MKCLFLASAAASFALSNGFQITPTASKIGPPMKSLKTPLKPTRNESNNRRSSTLLQATPASASSSPNTVVDTEALVKYGAAATTQLVLISAFFFGLDKALSFTELSTLPSPITWVMMYGFSLKSRAFNPLNNDRPNREKAVEGKESGGFNDRIQPNWTPPGVVFPIMWLLIIAPLRATSSMMLVNSLGGYLSLPLMSLMLHLTCGDVWNTINNTEKRFGTSVLAISTVYASALHAAYRYYEVDQMAGTLLGATAIWLTIASCLIIQTWRLNVNEEGEKDSILPRKVEGEKSLTSFAWF